MKSRISGQGLVRGVHYHVVDVDVWETPFGGFVTYTVVPVDDAARRIHVANGHLVLQPAPWS